jgi:hypothetical protein
MSSAIARCISQLRAVNSRATCREMHGIACLVDGMREGSYHKSVTAWEMGSFEVWACAL